MQVSIFLEQRFVQTPDGHSWTQVAFAYPFWLRYLSAFESVQIVARVQPVLERSANWLQVDGQNVTVAALPYYVGPVQYLKQAVRLKTATQKILSDQNAILFRAPSALSASVLPRLKQRRQPFGVEVVGDPFDMFAPGAVEHPLRIVFRWWFTRQLKRLCASAAAVAYVTEGALQRRYEPPSNAFTTHYSSVELLSEAFAQAPRQYDAEQSPFRIVTVGTLAQMYKGVDVLLEAVRRCVDNQIALRLTILGDGKHKSELQAYCVRLGLGQHVSFVGQVPAGETVRAYLDAADLFVLSSRQEGLPRAMIEAMARGLPCIGTSVGGIPELLPPEDRVPSNNPEALAAKLQEIIADPERMSRMSARNLKKAREYHEDVLSERRTAFYRYLREKTSAWQRSKSFI